MLKLFASEYQYQHPVSDEPLRAALGATAMQVTQEALLAQTQANCDLACANRITAEALLLAMSQARGCCVMPRHDDELQAWFHDARGVASSGSAFDPADGGIGEAVGCSSARGEEVVGGMPRPPEVDVAVGAVFEHATIVGCTGEAVGCYNAVLPRPPENYRSRGSL